MNDKKLFCGEAHIFLEPNVKKKQKQHKINTFYQQEKEPIAGYTGAPTIGSQLKPQYPAPSGGTNHFATFSCTHMINISHNNANQGST